jgi:antitoxin component YwqK of YwqJK toxin-antitoxin module
MRARTPLMVIITALLLHQRVACQYAGQTTPTSDTLDRPAESVELVEEFWPDGKLRLRRQVTRQADGTLLDHGTYTRWYQNGRKEYEATYVRGQLHGVETAWHENGEKRTEQHFDQGLRQGTRWDWDEQGRLRREERYLKDRPHGTWTIWKSDGTIKWQARFDHGKPLP